MHTYVRGYGDGQRAHVAGLLHGTGREIGHIVTISSEKNTLALMAVGPVDRAAAGPMIGTRFAQSGGAALWGMTFGT